MFIPGQSQEIGYFCYVLLILIAKIANSIVASKLCFWWNLQKRSKKNKKLMTLMQIVYLVVLLHIILVTGITSYVSKKDNSQMV